MAREVSGQHGLAKHGVQRDAAGDESRWIGTFPADSGTILHFQIVPSEKLVRAGGVRGAR
jgi:hypothetical protein